MHGRNQNIRCFVEEQEDVAQGGMKIYNTTQIPSKGKPTQVFLACISNRCRKILQIHGESQLKWGRSMRG